MTRLGLLLLLAALPIAPAPIVPCAVAQPSMMQLPQEEATAILGRPVLDLDGKAAGRIVDVLVDGTGQVRAAVVDFGGFLGVGNRRVAIDWKVLRFDPATRSITLTMSANEIAAAPEFKTDTPARVFVTPTPPADVPKP